MKREAAMRTPITATLYPTSVFDEEVSFHAPYLHDYTEG